MGYIISDELDSNGCLTTRHRRRQAERRQPEEPVESAGSVEVAALTVRMKCGLATAALAKQHSLMRWEAIQFFDKGQIHACLVRGDPYTCILTIAPAGASVLDLVELALAKEGEEL